LEEGKKGIDVKQKLERPFGTAIGDGAPGMTGGAQDWRFGLPTLCGQGLCLREPTTADSKQLAALVTPDTTWRFTPRAPDSDADWARFVERLHADRAAGLSLCYAVVREQTAEVAGLIMVRRFGLTFDIAECYFLFSEAWWTSALPARSLGYVLDFAFHDIGLHRLEARSSIGHEGDVLRSLGCVAEGLLRDTCPLQGGLGDETIWSMLRADWLSSPLPSSQRGPAGTQPAGSGPAAAGADNYDPLPAWSKALPTLVGSKVTLREVESRDGMPLLHAIDPAEIEVCIEPAPKTIEMFQQYIAWARRQRARGRAVSFSIFANGSPDPIGMIQLRSRDQRFAVAEWGIFLEPASRGTGVYTEVMSLILPFLFDTIGAHRLESRTSATNGAAIGSLHRLGAVKEACLRQSFRRHGEYQDDELWALTARDWRGRS
jgi:RimJ/RimL family protein N-acetyltransferase